VDAGLEGSTLSPIDSSVTDAPEDNASIEGLDASQEGGLDATDAADVTESEADVAVPCGPPTGGTYFVDPNAGHDDDGGTGSQACPFKSLTHALSLVGDAGTPVTVEIVNTASAPTLSQGTGEVFPITVPGGVTIIAEDTTKEVPTIEVSPTASAIKDNALAESAGLSLPAGSVVGLYLAGAGARLTYLTIQGPGQEPSDRSEGIIMGAGGEEVDHVTVQNFLGLLGAIAVGVQRDADAGSPVVGPGVVVDGNGQSGLYVNNGQAIVKGGQGPEHTSFRHNNFGIYLWGGTVDVEGTEIDPVTPDVSDVDVDVNGIGLNSMDNDSTPSSVVRGLHVQGNSGYGLLYGSPLVLRGSYIANNAMGGVIVEGNGLDLGNPAGPDYGRNIFVGNTGGDICGQGEHPVLAVGNIFGTVDCAVGGKLDPSVTCGDTIDVNVSNCTF